MAKLVAVNAGLYLSAHELTRAMNNIELSGDKDVLDCSTFGAGAREYAPGLRGVRFAGAGFLDTALADEPLFNAWQGTSISEIITVLAQNQAGGVAKFFRASLVNYGFGAPIGAVATITLSGQSTQPPLVNGKCLHRATAANATGSSTPIEFDAVQAAQSIYGVLHVFHAAGTTPTLAVKIQSDDGAGFSSPVDRLTFATATAVTSEWKSAGPAAITDTYWRVNYTIGGTTPVFGFMVAFGIV